MLLNPNTRELCCREQPSSPQERYGDKERAEAPFDDAPPPGDEEEEGEELFDQNFDVR